MLHGALRRTGAGVELGELSLEWLSTKKQTFARLKSRAELLSRQVNYLDERLEIVDHDRRAMYIQLRSLPPYKDDTQIQFNEICIGKDRVEVKRIAFYRRDEVKQQVPLNLSQEDFSASCATFGRCLARSRGGPMGAILPKGGGRSRSKRERR